ncbi:MAG: glycosyltransferase family protein [Gammaproteobacteria bacterium]
MVNKDLIDYVPLSLVPWQLARRLGKMHLFLTTLPSIKYCLRKYGFSEVDVLLIDAPTLAGLPKYVKARVMGYRATDLSSEQLGVAIDSVEQELAHQADFLIGTSALVMDRLTNLAPSKPVYLLENGVDYTFFSMPMDPPPEYREISSPRLVYAGAFDDRFGYGIVTALADMLPHANVVLIGPYPKDASRLLGGRGNLHLLGPRSYARLPAYFQHSDIGLLPLSNHPANDGRSPMKLFEYGASGLPVVASRTIELARRNLDFIRLANSSREFAEQVGRLLENSEERFEISRFAKAASASHSWTRIAERLIQDICIKALDDREACA